LAFGRYPDATVGRTIAAGSGWHDPIDLASCALSPDIAFEGLNHCLEWCGSPLSSGSSTHPLGAS
jgi:hypothetical protein